MKTTGNEIILSNGKAFRYNPHIFNKDSVLSWSIRKGEWLVTEKIILDLISIFNIAEINFAGKSKIIVKDYMDYYIETDFTEPKITSIRVIKFFTCKTRGFELVPYKTSRGYLSLDNIPVSFKEKTSIPLSNITSFKAEVLGILAKFNNFKFE